MPSFVHRKDLRHKEEVTICIGLFINAEDTVIFGKLNTLDQNIPPPYSKNGRGEKKSFPVMYKPGREWLQGAIEH